MTEKGAKQTPAPHSINAEALTLSALASFSTMVMVGFLRPRDVAHIPSANDQLVAQDGSVRRH